jgi:hypothetical protein
MRFGTASADKKDMKRLLALTLLVLAAVPVPAYKILYAEQWYNLVHRHLYEDPDSAMENIYYLERALRSDFANPLNALTPIKDEKEWERYRALFRMHVNLLLVQQTLTLASNFDKQQAYFYNYPWKAANLDSLDKAEAIYKTAFGYWNDAKTYAAQAENKPPIYFENLQYWIDEQDRIETGDLDYQKIIQKQLDRLAAVRAKFQAMNPQTY